MKIKEESVGLVDKLGVVGAGTMGHGIAQVAAQAGFEVTLGDARAFHPSRGYR